MSDFKELDPPRTTIVTNSRWYVGTLNYGSLYLHNDLLLHAETVNSNDEWNGLFDTELEAMSTCRQYYIKHAMSFPYEIRYQHILNSGQKTNTTSCQSQTMVFK